MDESVVKIVAQAMELRAAQPVGNISSLEPVMVGSLGVGWEYLARAAIVALREPSEAMTDAARDWSIKKYGKAVGSDGSTGCWQSMIDAALSE